jgi:hypothetical protein
MSLTGSAVIHPHMAGSFPEEVMQAQRRALLRVICAFCGFLAQAIPARNNFGKMATWPAPTIQSEVFKDV